MAIRPEFISESDFKLLTDKFNDESQLRDVINKIKNNYPVQYAIGDVEFLNNRILVDERVLIPRFETELLVCKLIEYIESFSLENTKMVDICTGSGCIAIALKSKLKNANVNAIDISNDALELANSNSKLNGTTIQFSQCDVLKEDLHFDNISVIVSNPPYVKENEEVTPNTKFEPNIALYPGEDDIIFYKRILDQSKNLLNSKNIIAFEIGSNQADRICDYAKMIYPYSDIKVEKDYAGYDRFIFIFNNCE